MEETSMEADSKEVIIRPNSVWIHGVDNLSTKDIKKYIIKYSEEDNKIEWINDESVNIVFETDESASSFLSRITVNETEFKNTEERLIHPIVEIGKDIAFTARISNLDDKKVKNAAQYSRYYLFNPKEEKHRSRHNSHNRRRENEERENNYREREVHKRRERNNEDEDLFPTRPIDIEPKDLQVEENSSNLSLLDRIGEKVTLSSKISTGELDDDDLFKK